MPKTFESLQEIRDALGALPRPDMDARAAAEARNAILTKPAGALGRLENIAVWYASWRGDDRPFVLSPQIAIFAGNHGVTAKGVSAFPAEVTVQMVANFETGGAAINQLAKLADARFSVHPIELEKPTHDFTETSALTEEEFLSAFNAGVLAVNDDSDLLVVGEMGIGNTTTAAALFALVFGGSGADWVGRGTGVDDEGLQRKAQAVDTALTLHKGASGLEAMLAVAGREMVAMAGAITAARRQSIPVVLDGFVATASLAALWSEEASSVDHCVAGHLSDETAHKSALEALKLDPLLDLGLRLGEGSGAALAIQIVKGALACHSGMATFEDAGVSDGG